MNKKKKILVIIDMQNDFVSGALKNEEAEKIVPIIVEKLKNHGKEYSSILFTRDTHNENYMSTLEGKYLPVPHCIKGTEGNELVTEIYDTLNDLREDGVYIRSFRKNTFASDKLIKYLEATSSRYEIELIGVCTDICVVSNALGIRAALPNTTIIVDASCCAGTSFDNHRAALKTMKSCQIDVINEKKKKSNGTFLKHEEVQNDEEDYIEQSD